MQCQSCYWLMYVIWLYYLFMWFTLCKGSNMVLWGDRVRFLLNFSFFLLNYLGDDTQVMLGIYYPKYWLTHFCVGYTSTIAHMQAMFWRPLTHTTFALCTVMVLTTAMSRSRTKPSFLTWWICCSHTWLSRDCNFQGSSLDGHSHKYGSDIEAG